MGGEKRRLDLDYQGGEKGGWESFRAAPPEPRKEGLRRCGQKKAGGKPRCFHWEEKSADNTEGD